MCDTAVYNNIQHVLCYYNRNNYLLTYYYPKKNAFLYESKCSLMFKIKCDKY